MIKVDSFLNKAFIQDIFTNLSNDTLYKDKYWFVEYNKPEWIDMFYRLYMDYYQESYIIALTIDKYKLSLENYFIRNLPLLWDLQIPQREDASKDKWRNKDLKNSSSNTQYMGVNSDSETPSGGSLKPEDYGDKSTSTSQTSSENNNYTEAINRIVASALPELLIDWIANFKNLHYDWIYIDEPSCKIS